MPKINRPRRGSLAFSPRRRAKSPIPKYQSWPLYNGVPILQGFAGYKVGMTHVIMVDDHKNSPTEGKEIMVPVTVVEIPSMKVAAIRAYSKDTYGKHALTEVWADQLDTVLGRRITLPKNYDKGAALKKFSEAVASGIVTEIYAVSYTQPAILSGVPKKVPDLMEIKVGGGDLKKQWEFAQEILGKEVSLNNVIQTGAYADITAITTGKGSNGAVKRWGIALRKRKHSVGGKERHLGTLVPGIPIMYAGRFPRWDSLDTSSVRSLISVFLRTSDNASEITPAGGFLHYGVLKEPVHPRQGIDPGSCQEAYPYSSGNAPW